MAISKRCQYLGEMLLHVEQDLWNAMDNLRLARELQTPVGFQLAKVWVEGAKKSYDTPMWTPEFTDEELLHLNESIAQGLHLIGQEKDIEASAVFEEARRFVHNMLFQKVVDCECPKRE